jgi:hypothetical protein
VKLTIDVVVAGGEEVFVFPRARSTTDEFEMTWDLWGQPELAREIGVALMAAVDAMQSEASEAMRLFLRKACERLDEERRLDEQAVEQEWRP